VRLFGEANDGEPTVSDQGSAGGHRGSYNLFWLSFISMLIKHKSGEITYPIFERYYKDILPIYMNTHRETLPTLFFLTLFLFTPALALAIPTGIQGFAASAGVTGGQGGRNIVVLI
jgi:hypothetical protein